MAWIIGLTKLSTKQKRGSLRKNSDERGPNMYEYRGSNSLLAGCNKRSSPIPVASPLGSYGSIGRDLYYRLNEEMLRQVSSYIVFFLVTIWLLLIVLFVNLRSEDTFRFHLGLSLFMFIFALVGNSTYVGSIRVNSLEWCKIKPNLPWLVDAGGCVLLDAFISYPVYLF